MMCFPNSYCFLKFINSINIATNGMMTKTNAFEYVNDLSSYSCMISEADCPVRSIISFNLFNLYSGLKYQVEGTRRISAFGKKKKNNTLMTKNIWMGFMNGRRIPMT